MKPAVTVLLIVAALVSGCAPAPQRMSDADRKTVRVVTVSDKVTKPPVPFYLGPGGGAGLAFGALGAIATESGRADARTSFLEFLDKNNVSIERIVLEEFSAALRRSGKLRVADRAEPGTPAINIAIKQYGLSIPHGFSSNLLPILSVECTMLDTSGKTVWSASDRLLTLGSPMESQPGEALRNDAKAIEKTLREAAKHVTTNIVNEL